MNDVAGDGERAGSTPFTVVIADDEAVVREGVRDRIPWADLGYALVSDCEDGQRALEAVNRLRPDLLITDIRMPFLNGLELARRVAAESPQTRVLLLTGHDEFEYAHEAVRLHVADFLLKPISSRELQAVLTRVHAELVAARTQREAERELRAQWEASIPLLRERVLNDVVQGSRPLNERLTRLEEVGISLAPGRVRTVLVSLDADETEAPPIARPFVPLAVGNMARAEVGDAPQVYHFGRGEALHAMLILGPDDDLFARLDRLRRRCAAELGAPVTIGVGHAYGRLQDLPRSLREAERALMQRFLGDGNRVIVAGEAADEPVARSEAPFGTESAPQSTAAARDEASIRDELNTAESESVAIALRNGDGAAARAAVDAQIEACRRRRAPVERCILALQRELARVLDAADDLDVPLTVLTAGTENPFAVIARLGSLDAIGRWLHEVVARFVTHLETRHADQMEQRIRAAQAYVREHFDDPDLSLTEVCNELSVSVSHFSSRFKQRTGQSFVEYLTSVRIGRARELIATGAGKSYEVAARVGFRDPNYFSSTFKKVTGMTPTQFRRTGAQA